MKSSPLRPCGWMKIERSGGWDENDSVGGTEMNKEHGPRCSDKLFTSFFNTVLPAAFHWGCQVPTKAGTGRGSVVPRAEGKKELCEETQKWGEAKKNKKKPTKRKKLLIWAEFGLPLQFANPGPKLYLHSRGASRGRQANQVIARGPRAGWDGFFYRQSWKSLKFLNTAM